MEIANLSRERLTAYSQNWRHLLVALQFSRAKSTRDLLALWCRAEGNSNVQLGKIPTVLQAMAIPSLHLMTTREMEWIDQKDSRWQKQSHDADWSLLVAFYFGKFSCTLVWCGRLSIVSYSRAIRSRWCSQRLLECSPWNPFWSFEIKWVPLQQS